MKLYQVVALGLGGVWLYGFLKHKQGIGSYSNAFAGGCTVYNASGDTRPVIAPVIQSIATVPPAPPSLTRTKFSPQNCYGPAAPQRREMPAPSSCGVVGALVAGEPEDTPLQTIATSPKFSPQNCYGPAAPATAPVTVSAAAAPTVTAPAPMNTSVTVPTGNCGYILQETPIVNKFKRPMYDEL